MGGPGRAHPAHWAERTSPATLALGTTLKMGSPIKLVPLTFLPYLYALAYELNHGTYICTCDLNVLVTAGLASLRPCKAWCLYMHALAKLSSSLCSYSLDAMCFWGLYSARYSAPSLVINTPLTTQVMLLK